MGLTKQNLFSAGALTVSLSGILLSGCTQTTEAPSATASVSAAPVPSAPAGDAAVGGTNNPGTLPPGPANAPGIPPQAGGGGAPFAGGGAGGGPTAPLSPTLDLDKKIADADKGNDKKAIAAAYTARGTFRLNDDAAGARVKYRAALEDFRKAIAADPTNKVAQASKKTIEDIYKSMGRPIPQ